jgi:hypothetical protein
VSYIDQILIHHFKRDNATENDMEKRRGKAEKFPTKRCKNRKTTKQRTGQYVCQNTEYTEQAASLLEPFLNRKHPQLPAKFLS